MPEYVTTEELNRAMEDILALPNDKLDQLLTECDPTVLSVDVAAIRDHDGTVYSTPRPGRHHTVIGEMVEKGCKVPVTGKQGFVLSDGSFVMRKPAAEIAIKAGQIKALRWPPNLYSEDLW